MAESVKPPDETRLGVLAPRCLTRSAASPAKLEGQGALTRLSRPVR